jgi:hypothetical protein
MSALMERMDTPPEGGAKPRPIAPIMIGAFLRLVVAVAALYVSLKTLDGSVYALAAGLVLGLVSLMIEALRLMKAWTV